MPLFISSFGKLTILDIPEKFEILQEKLSVIRDIKVPEKHVERTSGYILLNHTNI